MKFLVILVFIIAAASADVSLLTDRNGYSYSKPIPSVSLVVPEPLSPATIAPTPGPVPAPAPVRESGGQSHGSVESVGQLAGQSFGSFDQSFGNAESVAQSYGVVGSVGQSLGSAGSVVQSYGPVGLVGQSDGQSYGVVGQSFGNTKSVGSLSTQSYAPPVVPSDKYFGALTQAVSTFGTPSAKAPSVPAVEPSDFSAYLPPQPKYQAQAAFQNHAGPALASGYNAEDRLLSGYQALAPQVDVHSVGALGYFGSASLSGFHAQNLVNGAEYQHQVPQVQAQVPTYSVPTVAHQDHDAPTSGSVTPSNEYLPAVNGQLDVRSLGGSQDLISAPVTAPFTQYPVFGGPHSTSPSSASGDANLSSGPLAAPQLAAPAPADHKEYSAPASKTGGYHYKVPV